MYLAASRVADNEILVAILTNVPLRKIGKSWRLAKLAMKLGEHEIAFKPRSIKAQVLSYFVVEITGHKEVTLVGNMKTKDANTKNARNEQ
uniref:Uncharacterized protein n=1 Tax=Lactuca sativa TaxID=4236 RepID=A0A9R1USR2_LACSA|nr:hypothetical protein LSAT_V11C800405840 [Lactuca sativa]